MTQAVRNATKSHRPSKTGMQRTWYLVDASKAPLGRVSTLIANLLTGKNRADFAPDVDMGGQVVVINASKAVLTGQKAEKKVYFRHTGHTGGIRHRTFAEQMTKDPRKVIYSAVSGMLPKNRHRDLRLNNRLYIFPEAEHTLPHKMNTMN